MRRLYLAAALLCACSSPREPEERPAARWVREVRQLHARADREAPAPASRELAAFAERSTPPDVFARDVIETRQDLFARAAQLALAAGEADRALALAEQGSRLAGEGPFHTQLLILISRAKTALGDLTGAAEATQAARASLR